MYHDRKRVNGCLGEGRKEWKGDPVKGCGETFGGDAYVHSLDCSNGFTGVCIC